MPLLQQSISWPPSPQQQTCSSGLQQANGAETDGQTNTVPFDAMQAVPTKQKHHRNCTRVTALPCVNNNG